LGDLSYCTSPTPNDQRPPSRLATRYQGTGHEELWPLSSYRFSDRTTPTSPDVISFVTYDGELAWHFHAMRSDAVLLDGCRKRQIRIRFLCLLAC